MNSALDRLMLPSQNSLDQLAGKVAAGEGRLHEPQRLRQQIHDVQDRMHKTAGVVQGLTQEQPPAPEPVRRRGLAAWLLALLSPLFRPLAGLWSAIRALFRRSPAAPAPPPDVATVLAQKLQACWAQRRREAADEQQAAAEAAGRTQQQCAGVAQETQRLHRRRDEAREVHYTDPAPPPQRRRRPWSERWRRAWEARSLRVFFDKYEIIQAPAVAHVVRVDAFLHEPDPDVRGARQLVDSAAGGLQQLAQLGQELAALALPAQAPQE